MEVQREGYYQRQEGEEYKDWEQDGAIRRFLLTLMGRSFVDRGSVGGGGLRYETHRTRSKKTRRWWKWMYPHESQAFPGASRRKGSQGSHEVGRLEVM